MRREHKEDEQRGEEKDEGKVKENSVKREGKSGKVETRRWETGRVANK